eukprot:jgi/Mesvir1/11573/Mv04335-RA.1
MRSGAEYIGATSRPDVYDVICGDDAYESMTSYMADNDGRETVVVPASAFDAFNIDTRVRGVSVHDGSAFDDQLEFGAQRLPRPEDVVGATLQDHKVGVGYITSNTKDFPVHDIQVLRPYIPAPVGTDNWGTIGVATRGAFGHMLDDGRTTMDPRFTTPVQSADVRGNGIFGFPSVTVSNAFGLWGQTGKAPPASAWGEPSYSWSTEL